ncbi:polypeptide deformylase [Buchnera aphidicola (Nipponaphis monzeni)]|uniref:Peptide deformylase n=1 Tax=Buchnera aphidicola (Nipponaphis monzeni) TaxID=2495405 RepID=A0A455TAM8_9GAMM|nr:peptide deformylase [Buchnera aphidicola]BBI01373.1 polypeptide deformylase [Buchnera aphidicola (Nipponaphis monzeni)]
MTILKILQYPDVRLRKVAKPVIQINKYIKKVIHDMFETLHSKNGIGLAATQININLQIIVINNIQNIQPLVLINPKIKKKIGIARIEEGCLSIPSTKATITRAKKIHICATNYNGINIKLVANSLLSVCIQHEIDHLKGILFIDYLSNL